MPALRPYAFNVLSAAGGIYVTVRSVFRYFVTGRAISGKPRDNATFLRAATKDYRDAPVERLSGPIWHRLARRWVAFGVPLILLVVSLFAGHGWAVAAHAWWITGALAGLAWSVATLENWLVNRKAINEYVYPTWKAVTDTLGVPYHKRDARKNVKLPPGFIPPDIEITEPGQHSRLSRWTGVAWVQDKITLRRLLAEAERIKIEAVQDTEAGKELAVPAKPGQFALYRDRVVHAFKPQPQEETEEEAPVRIYLPKSLGVESVKSNLIKNVGIALGFGVDPIPSWKQGGRRPYVELIPRRMPPKAVGLAEMRRWIDQATVTRIPIGLDAYGHPVWLDLDNNSPHWFVSAPSGAGKSKFIMAVEALRMRFGVATIFVDFKRVSHRWAHGLRGSVYAWRIEECHDVLALVGQELIRRINDVLPEDATVDTPMQIFPEIDVIVEETNSLVPMLAEYWKEIRDPRKDPITSPAITAINQATNMGREFRIHMVRAAQRASASTFGPNGGDSRENYSFRILGKWSLQTWKVLAGGIPYLRPPKGGRGIFAVIDDDDMATIIRGPLFTDLEAIALASSGVPCPLSPMGPAAVPADPEAVPEPDAIPAEVTLRAAEHLLPGSPIDYKALRNAKDRDSTFPKPVGMDGASMTFEYSALVEWKLTRDARRTFPVQPSGSGRSGKVYRIDTLIYPGMNAVECGYVGQSWREIRLRGEEHWGDKPWADLVVGNITVIWESDDCTPAELDAMELEFITELMPRYNYQGQEGVHWAVPLYDQPKQRWERDRATGRPLWVSRDVYTDREAGEAVEVAAVTRA